MNSSTTILNSTVKSKEIQKRYENNTTGSIRAEPQQHTQFDDIHETPSSTATSPASQSFNYLEGGELTTIFADIPTDVPIQANTVIFMVNENKHISPFFCYLFECGTTTAEFPKSNIEFQPDAEDEDAIKTQIMNPSLEYITDLFHLHDKMDESTVNEMFKGFIWNGDKKTVYLFFNVTEQMGVPSVKNPPTTPATPSVTPPTTPPTTLNKWGLWDEIINKTNIHGISISPDIVAFFTENIHILSPPPPPPFTDEYPLSVYLCGMNTEGGWTTDVNVGIVEKTVPHPLLGDHYFFSTFPIGEENAPAERYALFPALKGEEQTYIVKDINTLTEEQRTNYLANHKDTNTNINTTWFKDRGTQLWCVKFPSQFVRMGILENLISKRNS
jgi:hypothetical protein